MSDSFSFDTSGSISEATLKRVVETLAEFMAGLAESADPDE